MGRINVIFPIFVDSNVQPTNANRVCGWVGGCLCGWVGVGRRHNAFMPLVVHVRAGAHSSARSLPPVPPFLPLPKSFCFPIPQAVLPISCFVILRCCCDDDRSEVCDVLVGLQWGVWMRVCEASGLSVSTLGKNRVYRLVSTRSCKLTWLVLG